MMKKRLFVVASLVGVLFCSGCGDPLDSLNNISQSKSQTEAAVATKAPQKIETTAAAKKPTQSSQSSSQQMVNGMRKDFKEAMDAYEKFYDDYVDFMKKYMANPYDMNLLTQYASIMVDASTLDQKFEAWESSDLNDKEMKYYIEVNARVQKKLLEVTK